ncbi:MAG: hypothetical protein EXS58_12900 [Candidatus Latescibacteria bacterium]|nr:hypothetical protein [Candidatus Latescibacterota bacterium]
MTWTRMLLGPLTGLCLAAHPLLARKPVVGADLPPWNAVGRYTHAPIEESSGLVVSYQYPGVYWTLNDSGNAPVLYATRLDGTLIGEFAVQGAENSDWEALSLDDQGQLWIGEIGNNSRRRDDLMVYVVAEPNPFAEGTVQVAAQYPYRYPAENVDAEGMFIAGGLPYIFSKEQDRAVLYRFPALRPDEQMVLERVGEAREAQRVTDAALSRDGQRLALCTYDRVWIYEGNAADPAALIAAKPWSLAHDFAVEANAFEGYDLVLTSEERSIYRLPQWWYERQLALPPQKLESALDRLESTAARQGRFRVQPYTEAGLEIGGAQLLLEGAGPGAQLSQILDFSRADRYAFTLALTQGPAYGTVELLVDGQPLGQAHDCRAAESAAGVLVDFGARTLTQGRHELALRLAGDALQAGLAGYLIRSAAPFATQYQVLGPFAKAADWDIDAPLPPEQDLGLGKSFAGAAGSISWQRLDADTSGWVDFLSALPNTPSTAVAYALTYVFTPKPCNTTLLVGSDDQVAVWVNGTQVHRHNVARGAVPDEDVASCELQAGWNQVLCKVGQNGGDWGLYLRFADPEGNFNYSADGH